VVPVTVEYGIRRLASPGDRRRPVRQSAPGTTTITLDVGDATEVQLLVAAENADVTVTIDGALLVDEVVWEQDLLSWSGPVSGQPPSN
jgi:hypothetical protein